MRFLCILSFLLYASHCIYTLSDIERKFQRHLAHFGKIYSSEEYLRRLQIFSENAQRAHQWSSEKLKYSVEGNKFADFHPSEFKATILCLSFDWRSKNAVNPVRDQGSLGTCWAFSTVENIEGQRAIHHQIVSKISSFWSVFLKLCRLLVGASSPEQLVECDASTSAASREADCGIFGGWPSLAYEYLIKAGRIRTEKDFPYCVGTASCWPCMAQSYSADLCGDHSDLYCNASTTLGQRANDGWCSNDDKVAVKLSDWKAVSQNERKSLPNSSALDHCPFYWMQILCKVTPMAFTPHLDKTLAIQRIWIMQCCWWDTELRMEFRIGLSRTHGEINGERRDISVLSEDKVLVDWILQSLQVSLFNLFNFQN